MKEKTYEIHFRHRDDGTLNDAFERGQATSKAKAILWGKAIASERGWWFMGVRKLEDDEL